jgi:hypothetical protein
VPRGGRRPPEQFTEMIGVFDLMFRRIRADETILTKMKPFSVFGASRTKRRMVIKLGTTAA